MDIHKGGWALLLYLVSNGCRSFNSLVSHLTPDFHILELHCYSNQCSSGAAFLIPLHQRTMVSDGKDVHPSQESDSRIIVLSEEAWQALFCPELCNTLPALTSLLYGVTTGRSKAKPQAGIAAILVGERRGLSSTLATDQKVRWVAQQKGSLGENSVVHFQTNLVWSP